MVGNGNYTAISNPRDDMTRALQGFDFTVTTLKDATRRELNTALETFSMAAISSQTAPFHFARHGMKIRSDNFLMPINSTDESKAVLRDEGVSLSPFTK